MQIDLLRFWLTGGARAPHNRDHLTAGFAEGLRSGLSRQPVRFSRRERFHRLGAGAKEYEDFLQRWHESATNRVGITKAMPANPWPINRGRRR